MHLRNVPTCLYQISGEKKSWQSVPLHMTSWRVMGGVYFQVSNVKILRIHLWFRGTRSQKVRPASAIVHHFYLATLSFHLKALLYIRSLVASEVRLPFWSDGNKYQPSFQGILDHSIKSLFSEILHSIFFTLIPQILQQEDEKQSCKLPKLLTQTFLANNAKQT